jgi:membrane fusion protein, multidrug efflux system
MKKKVLIVLVVVAIVFLLALPKLNLFKSKPTAVAGAAKGNGKLPVEVLVLKAGTLDNKLTITGSVLPNESLELKSETSGKITGLYFKEGNHVKKGDVLLQINDEEIKAELEKQVYNRKLNQDNEFRQRKLLEKDAISQEEYDNALNRLNTTLADIKVLAAQLDKTKIKAPFDGTIGLRYISEGAYISPASTIATLYNISPAKIEFSIPGRYSTQVSQGKKILFTIENDLTVYEGEVYAIEPRIDPATRTLSLRAIANNEKGALLPGQFVKVELILGTIDNAIMVPTEAVIPEQGGKKVFILENGKAKEVKIETGLRTNSELEVTAGLKPKDTLIVTGMLQLRGGMDIEIAKVNEYLSTAKNLKQ